MTVHLQVICLTVLAPAQIYWIETDGGTCDAPSGGKAAGQYVTTPEECWKAVQEAAPGGPPNNWYPSPSQGGPTQATEETSGGPGGVSAPQGCYVGRSLSPEFVYFNRGTDPSSFMNCDPFGNGQPDFICVCVID
eukprot:Hpha_TRINITY_DN22530_c0_g1::TRINITY_DN22530_c0_g1_i1::g.185098::m.185098